MMILRLAAAMLLRDWRAGELRISALALVIAVASVSSVGFFADRVRQALLSEAHQLLGADLVLVSDQPWPAAVRAEIEHRGLRWAEYTSFVSMARRGDNAQLASVKAASAAYPLRGRLRTAERPGSRGEDARTGPAKGSVWVDERLAAALATNPGDEIELGDTRLKAGAILTLEPDRGASFFNIAPRLMMHLDDLPATGLIQPGSRVWYHLLVAGEHASVRALEAWIAPRLTRGQSLQSLANARPEIRVALERAKKFIGLTALLAVALAAAAVSLSARRYTERHLDAYAMMRCLGASQRRLLGVFAGEFTTLGLAACGLGAVIGYGAQFVIGYLVAGLLEVPLPAPTLLPALQGCLTGMALLLGFALPPLLALKNVPALRVIRREVGGPHASPAAAYLLGAATLAALVVWQAEDLRLGLIVLAGFAAGLGVFGLIAYGVLQLLGRAGRGAGYAWRYGLANLRRHARGNVAQIVALALGLTALLLLTFTIDDLLASWRAGTPPDAPNRFIVNIQPDQREPLAAFFREYGTPAPETYPMVRARYVARNGVPVNPDAFQDRARGLVEREFNVSYMTALPVHNEIVAGAGFTAADLKHGALSVEDGIANTLGWKLGDRLSWQVAGVPFTAPIASIRRLDWDSMKVNFFVIGTPGLLSDHPASDVASFHLPASDTTFAGRLSSRFPNLTLIDTSAILGQLRALLDRLRHAVQFVFLFALAAGVLVLYTALSATRDERTREAAVMRSLGATRAQVLASQRVEFLALGIVAGLLAAAGAVAIGYLVAQHALQLPYRMNPAIWIAGPLLGLACVGLNAWAGSRAVLDRPPMTALREG
jgi:putative ABC transport system permease protein